MESMEDANASAEDKMVRWMRETISSQMTNFDAKSMWSEQLREACRAFLSSQSEDRLFVWVEQLQAGAAAVCSNVLSKEASKASASSEEYFMYFLKFTDKPVVLTEDNVDDFIAYGVLTLGDHLGALLYEMNMNTIPRFLKDREWPENIKKDLLEQTHKFMANLTEIESQKKGQTKLYLPQDNFDEELGSNDQKDRNHRLKEVLSHWTKQIRDLINNQTNQSDSDNSGPLEEIHNWTMRRNNLINIKEQLENPELNRILEILDRADPKNLKNFNDLVKNIAGGAEEAEDNLKYLQSLKEPCEELAKASPTEIVKIVPTILNCVRLIKEYSKHYKTEDKISGLLRKISNEIINRCKKCINLDDMLTGDVHRCINDLRNAISCGSSWRAVYNSTVDAIRKTGGSWQIKADSIFTQIEAFVQRCSDLIEICEGQTQFARKGRAVDLPKFSGSKGPEIISVLEEIKNSFGKYIERIQGSDKEKILDINSTKWHDDYSAFKTGAKNLEIMYLNLITSSFENVNKLSQVVEYIEAFDDLAQKATIKAHVHKQISKVNEIFKNELQIADQASKKPFSLPYNHGKSSGEAIWVRSLLYRIEKLKKIYDSLTFISPEYKKAIHEEYDRVERNLTQYMREIFNKFKKEYADLYEENIQSFENNRILVNSDDYPAKGFNPSDPKTKPVMIEAKAQGKGHIEANFNKDLLRILIETVAFKKLLKENIGNFGPKTEEYVALKREMLRCVRESVMIAVRDYNLVHDLMDSDEKRLFEQHLAKLSEHKDKGKKSIPWNPVVDIFVKKMKSQCGDVYISLMHFKNTKMVIREKISEISKYNKFIVFDTKEPFEIDQFCVKQQNNQNQISAKITNTFAEIKSMLANTFEDFVDKKTSIHVAWFDYVRAVDAQIEAELKKAVKTSFNDFYKAIKGDEANKSNPVHVFKVYIILRSTKEEYELTFDPKVADLIDKISMVLNRSVDVIGKLKHIELDLLETRARRVTELKEKQDEDKKRGLKNEDAVEYNPDNGFLIATRKQTATFKEMVSGEVKTIISDINSTLAQQTKSMNDQISPWKREHFKTVWSKAKKEYFKQFLKDMQASAYQQQIEEIEKVQNQIKNEQPGSDSICIYIDSSKIKQDISLLCQDALKNLLNEIKSYAMSKLDYIYNEFNKVNKELREEPEDLFRLKEAMDKLDEFNLKRPKIETEIPLLENIFKLLDANLESLSTEDTRRRQELSNAAEDFKKKLVEMGHRNSRRFADLNKNFNEKISKLQEDVRENKENFDKGAPFAADESGVDGAFKKISIYKESTETFRQRVQDMSFGIELFKTGVLRLAPLEQVEQEIENLKLIWNKKKTWNDRWNVVKMTKFRDIDTDEVKAECDHFLQDLAQLPKNIKDWPVTKDLVLEIKKIIENLPLITLLREPYMMDRHWDETKKLVASQEVIDEKSETFTFEKFVEYGFISFSEKISDIAENAQAQYKVEVMLKKIQSDWAELNIDQVPLASSPDIYVIKRDSVNNIFNKLEEDTVKLATLKTNISAVQFEAEIEKWDSDLNRVLESLETLYGVQRKFEYVNNIFINIQSELAQLAGDYSNFNTIRSDFKIHMERIRDNPNAKDSLTVDQFKNKFEGMGKELDKIQSALRDLLKQRRAKFARFYFLSDEDMFELLGNAKNPVVINKHLKKMFEGIKSLTVEEKVIDRTIGKVSKFLEMVSPEGEKIAFNAHVEVTGNLIKMMEDIEKQMKDTLKTKLGDSSKVLETITNPKNKSSELDTFIRETPGQIILLCIQLEWTKVCQDNIRAIQATLDKVDKGQDKENREANKQKKDPMKEQWREFKAKYEEYLKEIPNIMLKTDVYLVKIKINAMIIVMVHNRDIMNELSTACRSETNFDWLKQLRFEMVLDKETSEQNLQVAQANAKFFFGWEYQGNNGRLIITPLTDRCYLTLTTAMNLKKGGSPQGPAGTGKTETVKDLGKNMGRFVYIFNCSDGLDVKSLKTMFEGFAKTGSWSCFDEFNRIEIEVLSVVAIYIKNILDSLSLITKGEFGSVNLDDEQIGLNINCSIFITMNPGYAGRTELPDNLKALFRPISMMLPDNEMICSITLKSEGFQTSDDLAKKIKTLYDLMIQMLSKQGHYDFGLRAIKSVLNLAGKIKKKDSQKAGKQVKGKADAVSEESIIEEETLILIKAIRDMNDPKLVAEDIPLFMALLKDLFPKFKIESKKDKELSMEIHNVLIEQQLDNTDYCVNKIIQFFDSKLTRHGNMLVGKTFSGKSTVHKVLAKALTNLSAKNPKAFNKIQTFTLNPKAIEMNELYGYFDPSEDKSYNGVFSFLMETLCNKSDSPDQKWIIFDGPIDTRWIESMNSLLDDNKLLTLPGNRISLSPLVSLIFETENLEQASPATVSRCGMIFMDVDKLSYDSLKLRWLLQKEKGGFDEESLDTIEDLFDKWVDPILEAKRKGLLKDVIPLQENHLILNLLSMLDAFCIKENGINFDTRSSDEMFWIKFERWFTYCVIWSIGCVIHEDSRKAFDTLIRGIEDMFPLSQTVYDCYINVEKSEYLKWDDRLVVAPANYKPKEANTPRHKLLVETVETIRSRYLIESDLKNHLSMLMIGVTGTGKTAIMNSFLSELPEAEYSYSIINLSAQTSSKKLQQIVESKLNTSAKRKFRPHNGKKGVIFIDDFNMPKLDEFGSQPPLELIKQLIEYGGWYERTTLELFVEIEKTDLLCAMAPPSGGRNPISNRLSSKFHIVNMTVPSTLQIKRIYTSILNFTTQGFDGEVRSQIEKVVDLILDCFTAISTVETFKPTPAKSHYLFNLRDMSRIVQGMSMVDKDSCDSPNILLKLGVHEHLRVYRDRMISRSDKDELRKILDNLLGIHFQTNCAVLLKEGQDEIDLSDELLFVDFIDAGKAYSEARIQDVLKIVIDKQSEYNRRSKTPIDVVFFNDALKNMCRIHRILRMSNGHALLIGEGGSGRHSLTRMASYLAEYSEYQIRITKNYTPKHFQADIQSLFANIINKNQAYTFIFSDNEISSEGIIEDVNNILNLGEIPNLYQKKDGKDDFQPIRDKLRDKHKRETDEKIYDNFISKIQQSLHIAFCMSQSGNSLRNNARKYPGLINNTTQIWFNDWPNEALRQVATHYLTSFIEVELPPPEPKAEGEEEQEEEEEEDNGSEDEEIKAERKRLKKLEKENALKEELKKEKLASMSTYFANVHTQVKDFASLMMEELRRPYFVTPKSFIDFVREYMLFAKKKKYQIVSQLQTYSIGLSKLEQASIDAKKISEEIYRKNEEQKNYKKKLDEIAKKLGNEEKIVKNEVEKLRIKNEDIDAQKRHAEKLEYECKEKLALVQPILDEANEKVKELENKKAEFAEVKALATKKVSYVMLVLKPIMILMGESPTEDSIIKNLANNFVQRLIKTERETLVKDRQRFDKFEDLTKGIPTDLSNQNMAAETLRKYVAAVGSYIKALKAVMPTLEQIEKLKQMLSNLNKERADLEYKVDVAKERLAKMMEERKQMDKDLEEVEKVLQILEQRHERADDLVKGLSNSKESWTRSRDNLILEEKKVEGNVLLSVAFLNYFGPFPAEYREKLNKILISEVVKSKISYSTEWEFVKYIGDQVEVLDWSFKGLPSDQYSKENGVIVMNTVRWPLMIDPQNQANLWIKNHLGEKCFKTDPMNPKLISGVKTAIKEGISVLIENIDELIDPALEPALTKQIKMFDGKEIMVFGDDDIPYNRDFRLYLTTRLSNPTYKAEVSTKVSLVNFTVKEKGLEEQLLEELIKIMNKKLEDTRIESIQTISACDKQLKEQERLILTMLQESKVDMVDDINLIETLKSSREIEEKMVQSITTSNQSLEKNRIARDNYRPLGYVGSILYFTIYNLNKIDHMYQFSLESFIDLFRTIVTEKKEDKAFGGASEVIKEKIEAIDDGLRKAVYDFTCRGIFEKDKLLLSLQMCVNLAEYDEQNKKDKGDDDDKKTKGKKGKKKKEEEPKEGDEENKEGQKELDYFKNFFRAEYNFFLKGGIVLNRDNQMSNPDPSWITTQMWDNITEMGNLPNFQGIAGSFTNTNKDWKRYYASEQPETEPLPSDWSSNIKGFSLLALLRAIRPDRIPFAATTFVKNTLSEKFTNPPSFNIEEIYKTTTKNTPCLFILSPGADPLSYLENLAKERKAGEIVQVSLGQKQTARAKDKIKNGRTTGQWVFLANVHLSVDFLKDLEAIIEDIRNNKIDGRDPKTGGKQAEKLHDGFRLFMTANPSKKFPISILQKCTKITTEPPKGIKANMLKLYNNLVKDVFDKDDCKEVKKYSQMLFGLAWFHSLVIERKKFRTLGWNVMYDFNDSDFLFSDKLLRTMVDVPMPRGSPQSVQWDAIKFIIAEINYGGRVTDSWDRRLINRLAEELFTEEIFDSAKPFVLSNYKVDTEYKLPKEIIDETSIKPLIGDLAPLRETNMKLICSEYIETFPSSEIPGIFGSHGNAEVTSQKMETAILLDSLLNLQPRDAGASGKSREEAIINLLEDRMKALSEEINYFEARAKYPPTEEDPLRNVLLQEIARYNKVLAVVRETFVELLAGLRGQTLISESMEVVLLNIGDNKVPEKFKSEYLSTKPFNSWLDDLGNRVEMFRTWVLKGPPLVFKLGYFTFPTGFTTALKQKSARANKVAIDELKWEFTAIKSDVQQPPREGAYISDMYLEGARWTPDDFIDDEISMSLYCPLPVIFMKPVQKPARAKNISYYRSPVYYYPIREGTRENPSFLFEMTLPMNPELQESFFIKRGTACLLNLGD